MKLFVAPLDVATTEDSVRKFFGGYASVGAIKVVADKSGSKRYAFVDFSDTNQADHAIHKLDGKKLDGSSISVFEVRMTNCQGRG